MEEIEMIGNVTTKKFGKGSKSEHSAVYLDNGEVLYRLRMKAGNPFFDSGLQKLIGKRIKAKGVILQNFFVLIDKPKILKSL